MCCENVVFYVIISIVFLIGTSIINGVLYFSQDYLSLIDLSLSMNQYLWIYFELSPSNETFDYLGPFHLWSGREEKNCIEMDDERCKKWEKIPLNNSVYLYKLSNNYLTFVSYKRYLGLLKEGYIINENKNCQDKLKYCGKIDTLNQKLCLPENIECPIQDFQISNNEIIDYNNIKYSNKEITEFISYTNKKTDFFIIGNISIGSGPPCINKLEENWEKLENKEINETSYCRTKFDGVEYDKRFNKCGEISYTNIYESNLPKDVFNIIYNSLSGHKLKVYKRPYIGINLSCYENSNYNLNAHINSKETIISLKDLTTLYMKCLIIGICFLCAISSCCKGGGRELGLFLLFIIIIFFVTFLVKYIIIELKFLDLITDFNCSDEYTNSLVQLDNKNIKTNSILILILIIVFFISAIAFIIQFITLFIKECCKTPDYNYNKNNENDLSQSINNNDNTIN